jgi:hypothetical protein
MKLGPLAFRAAKLLEEVKALMAALLGAKMVMFVALLRRLATLGLAVIKPAREERSPVRREVRLWAEATAARPKTTEKRMLIDSISNELVFLFKGRKSECLLK